MRGLRTKKAKSPKNQLRISVSLEPVESLKRFESRLINWRNKVVKDFSNRHS